jgi:hypothetical protein
MEAWNGFYKQVLPDKLASVMATSTLWITSNAFFLKFLIQLCCNIMLFSFVYFSGTDATSIATGETEMKASYLVTSCTSSMQDQFRKQMDENLQKVSPRYKSLLCSAKKNETNFKTLMADKAFSEAQRNQIQLAHNQTKGLMDAMRSKLLQDPNAPVEDLLKSKDFTFTYFTQSGTQSTITMEEYQDQSRSGWGFYATDFGAAFKSGALSRESLENVSAWARFSQSWKDWITYSVSALSTYIPPVAGVPLAATVYATTRPSVLGHVVAAYNGIASMASELVKQPLDVSTIDVTMVC